MSGHPCGSLLDSKPALSERFVNLPRTTRPTRPVHQRWIPRRPGVATWGRRARPATKWWEFGQSWAPLGFSCRPRSSTGGPGASGAESAGGGAYDAGSDALPAATAAEEPACTGSGESSAGSVDDNVWCGDGGSDGPAPGDRASPGSVDDRLTAPRNRASRRPAAADQLEARGAPLSIRALGARWRAARRPVGRSLCARTDRVCLRPAGSVDRDTVHQDLPPAVADVVK
jgi:hypothetical protein